MMIDNYTCKNLDITKFFTYFANENENDEI